VIRAAGSNRGAGAPVFTSTSLIATSRPSRRSRAARIRPMPPRAISREIT
jgi:hypothetical protein